MELNDLDSVCLIENESFKYPWPKSTLKDDFDNDPFSFYFVALVDEQIVGFLSFLITYTSSTICQIAVKNEFRRQGIAQKLLESMYCVLDKNKEVDTITLEVRKSNIIAHQLYLKNGFNDVVVKSHYYPDGEDAIYMCKEYLLCRQY
jgi:ribosomal-protein-alanine N-acetyltransferase